jgi:hypothetical protein
MDKDTKQLVDDYLNWLEKHDTPEYKEKTEMWMKRFWELMRDHALGLIDEDAFDELDEIWND